MSEENKNIKTTTIQSIDNFFKDMSNLNIPTKIQPEEKITQKPIDYVDIVKRGYKEILNRDADVADIKNYSNKLKYEILTENTFRDILRNSDEYKESNSNELVYCMIGGNKLHEIKPYIETVLPYIDSFIYVDSYSTDGTIEYLNELSSKNNDKIIVIQHEWEDRFSMFRNYYLNYLRDINYRGYVLVSDSVSGERCTTILNEKGHIEVISFDELFNIYSKISTPVIDENGKEIIINPSIKILSSTQPKIFNVNKMQDLRNYPEEMNYLLNSNQLKYLTLYKNGNGYKKIGKLLNVPWNNVLSILANLRNKKKFISIKSEWCNVKKIIRHKTNKNMLHINTKYGGTCVTKDHSLIEIKNDNYEKIEPDKFINNNKNFVSINNIYNDKLLNKIDLYDANLMMRNWLP